MFFKYKLINNQISTNYLYKTTIFSNKRISYYLKIGIKFFEFLTGFKTYFYFNKNVYKLLSNNEFLICNIWSRKLIYFQRKVGFSLFINESLQIMYLTLKTRDVYLFLNWFKVMLSKINFWKHRAFLKYIRFLLHYVFPYLYSSLRVYGARLRVKGKISVAGNARKRTFDIKSGKSGYSMLKTKVIFKKDSFITFTGILGIKFLIFFA